MTKEELEKKQKSLGGMIIIVLVLYQQKRFMSVVILQVQSQEKSRYKLLVNVAYSYRRTRENLPTELGNLKHN